MPRIPVARTRIATLGTLFGLGVLTAVAISASSDGQPKPATAAAVKRPNVRTIVVHRTVGVLPTVPGAAPIAAAPAAAARAGGAAVAGAAPAAWSAAPARRRSARVYATAPRSTGRQRVGSGGGRKRRPASDDAQQGQGTPVQAQQEDAAPQAQQPAQSAPTTTTTTAPPAPTRTVTHTQTQEPQEPQEPQQPQEPQEPQR